MISIDVIRRKSMVHVSNCINYNIIIIMLMSCPNKIAVVEINNLGHLSIKGSSPGYIILILLVPRRRNILIIKYETAIIIKMYEIERNQKYIISKYGHV